MIGRGSTLERWFIHPDDVPSDPDADLIEAMAKALYSLDHAARDLAVGRDRRGRQVRKEYRDNARAALAVVREHEAKS